MNYSVSILWTSLQQTCSQSDVTSIFHCVPSTAGNQKCSLGSASQVGTGNLVASSGSKGQSGVVSGKETCSHHGCLCFSRESCLLPSCLIKIIKGRTEGPPWGLRGANDNSSHLLTPLLEEEANIMLLKKIKQNCPMFTTTVRYFSPEASRGRASAYPAPAGLGGFQ